MSNYCVYTYYDCKKQPLYVGKSTSVWSRYTSHGEPWKSQVCYVGVREYDERSKMSIAEIYHTARIHPVFNKENNEDPDKEVDKEFFCDESKEIVYTVDDFRAKYGACTRSLRKIEKPLEVQESLKKRRPAKKWNEKTRALIHRHPNAKNVDLSEAEMCKAFTHPYENYRIGNCFFSMRFKSKHEEEINSIMVNHFVNRWQSSESEHLKDRTIFEIDYSNIDDAIYPLLYIETEKGISTINPIKKARNMDGKAIRYELMPTKEIFEKLCKKGAIAVI